MPQEYIENPDDPRLAPYNNVRDADLQGRQGLFLAEGRVVVRALLTRSRFQVQSIYLSEKQLDAMSPLLAAHPHVPVYVSPQHIMNAVVGFDIHRGILAAGIRNQNTDTQSLLDVKVANTPMPHCVLVLDALANHDNVGGVFRNALAFGIHAVLLDPKCCDPLYRKAIRVSTGAVFQVPFVQQLQTSDSVTLLQRLGYHIAALTPRADAITLSSFLKTGPFHNRIALCLGAEGPGLPNNILDEADTLLRIEMEPGIDSLNASVACAIAAHAITQLRCN